MFFKVMLPIGIKDRQKNATPPYTDAVGIEHICEVNPQFTKNISTSIVISNPLLLVAIEYLI